MATPVKPLITFDDFEKLDIRAGTITKAENVEGSKKLVRLTVDFGDFKRNILSGMQGERDDIPALAGTQALFLVNLAPRKMAGELSEGMIMDVGSDDGIKPALAVPERTIPDGSRLG